MTDDTAQCLFCRIGRREIPGKFAYEDESVFAIYDVNPQAPVHLLVIPREHVSKISDAEEKHSELLGRLLLRAAHLAKDLKLEKGYRLVINNGTGEGQSVFHIHLHVLGGRPMRWPPG